MLGLLPPAQNHTSEATLNHVLKFVLPTLTALGIPLTLANLILICNLGIRSSPSMTLYFHLMIVDLLNSLCGVGVAVKLLRDPGNYFTWDTGLHNVDCYVFLFTFDANIILVLSIIAIRVLWLNMSASDVIEKLKHFAEVAVWISYAFGAFCVIYAMCIKTIVNGSKKLYPTDWIEATDVIECIMIFLIVALSIYTHVRINQERTLVSSAPTYKRAYYTSMAITTNFIVTYSYYLVLNAIRIYYRWNDATSCPVDSGIVSVVCRDSLVIGVTFMCFQSVVNSIVLLSQGPTKKFMQRNLLLCWRDGKRMAKQQFCYYDDYDYQYL